jgi:hypothetical protein
MDGEELDRCYAEAAKFDEAQQEKWLKANFVAFCRRTERPKLGYLIRRLNLADIACVLHGESAHAPILWVKKTDEAAAWQLLAEKFPAGDLRQTLDDIPDDDPTFLEWADEQPEPLEDWTGDPGRDPAVPGDR